MKQEGDVAMFPNKNPIVSSESRGIEKLQFNTKDFLEIDERYESEVQLYSKKVEVLTSLLYRAISLLESHQLRINPTQKIYIETGVPAINPKLNTQLAQLKFFEVNSTLTKHMSAWFNLIQFYSRCLYTSYNDKKFLRMKAQTWNSEVKDMHPLMNFYLGGQFGERVKNEVRISDGMVDHVVDGIPIEDKLLKKSKHEDIELVISELFHEHLDQVNRQSGISGFSILCVVDIRTDVKQNRIKSSPLAKCFRIFFENSCWYAVFIFQAFTKSPSQI